MFSRWPILTASLLTVLSVGAFATGGHLTVTTMIDVQRTRQIDDLVDLALRRAEVEVENGAQVLAELGRKGQVGCDSVSLQALRLSVYRSGPVKDIRVADRNGAVMCSAYAETLEFDRDWPAYDDMLAGDDAMLRLFRVEQFYDTALGVMLRVDDDRSLIAILSVDPALFDVMPAELRNFSSVSVELTNGDPVSRIGPGADGNAIQPMVSTVGRSASLPVRALVRIDAYALANWNREAYWPVMALSVGLGLAFGLMFARLATRPPDPISVLDKAIANHEFRPFLQPLFDLDSGRIVGCEMLARWIQSDGTIVPPSRFIELAERSGRIEAITWQLLSQALGALQPLMQADKSLAFSFNVAPRHFLAPGFVDELRENVSAARIAYRQIAIELTERQPFDDFDRAREVVDEVRGLGFKIAIDDVGIGHSGLSSLQQIKADVLKIDKFFVDSLTGDESAMSIVHTLVSLASKLDMMLVAEGIETRRQLEALREAGVQRGQGFLVSPPVPVHDFIMLAEAAARRDGVAKIRASVA